MKISISSNYVSIENFAYTPAIPSKIDDSHGSNNNTDDSIWVLTG